MWILVPLIVLAPSFGFDHKYTPWGKFISTFLQTHKQGQPKLNYLELKRKPELLEPSWNSLTSVTKTEYDSWTNFQRVAYLINSYNIAAIKLVLDFHVEKSFKEASAWYGLLSPFQNSIFPFLGGPKISLNALQEKIRILLPESPEFVFALYCPAKFCPALRYEPFVDTWIMQQIQDAAAKYFSNPAKTIKTPEAFEVSALMSVCSLSPRYHCMGNLLSKKYSPLTSLIKKVDPKFKTENVEFRFRDLEWEIE